MSKRETTPGIGKDGQKEDRGGLIGRILRWFEETVPEEHSQRSPHGAVFGQDYPHLSNRRWRLLQVEPTLACNLACIMCPWTAYRERAAHGGIMQPVVWAAVKPWLKDVQWVDFTGGGEPLLQPRLAEWMAEAKQEGCIVGLLTNGVLLNAKMAQELVDGGIDWICFSMDSSDKVEYERIRVGSNFDLVCRNIRHFSDLRLQGTKVMLNYVMMRSNIDQLPQLVELAAELGIDHINFKQCEVIRGVRGKDLGLFQEAETLETRRREALVDVARGLATKLGIRANVTPFIPVERCVCEQDPRNSMFVRFDGAVSPCINLANGGPTTFLGRDVVLPDISYGALPDNELPALWDSEVCLRYRTIFGERCRQYENVFMEGLVSDSRRTPQRLLEIAKRRMPRPPSGCEICHYLYGL